MDDFSHQFIVKLMQHCRLLGFDDIGFSDINLTHAELGLSAWINAGFHGEMSYMAKYGLKRTRPADLYPGTTSVISVRLPYLPSSLFNTTKSSLNSERENLIFLKKTNDWRCNEWIRLSNPLAANISLYARGRDYHKLFRKRLKNLAEFIKSLIGPYHYRVCTDSAPVMEVELAKLAKLGWRGKHTLLLDPKIGSFFFLGEIFTDLPLSFLKKFEFLRYKSEVLVKRDLVDNKKVSSTSVEFAKLNGNFQNSSLSIEGILGQSYGKEINYCGRCQRCLDICPTGAIIAPHRLDARLCISYLTIEFKGVIPINLRAKIGNRIYGCDDCQLICPWNKFSRATVLLDFDVRNNLDRETILGLFSWTEEDFLVRMEGSAIRRIGYDQWLRNIAIALGNALATRSFSTEDRKCVLSMLRKRLSYVSLLVAEHIQWAINQDPGFL